MRFTKIISCIALFGVLATNTGCGDDTIEVLFNLLFPVNTKTVSAATADVKYEVILTNTSDSPLILTWERTLNEINRDWNSAFCDNNACYPPNVSTQTFTVEANHTDTLSLHFYPAGIVDTGTVTIEIFKTDDRANTTQSVTATLTTN